MALYGNAFGPITFALGNRATKRVAALAGSPGFLLLARVHAALPQHGGALPAQLERQAGTPSAVAISVARVPRA